MVAFLDPCFERAHSAGAGENASTSTGIDLNASVRDRPVDGTGDQPIGFRVVHACTAASDVVGASDDSHRVDFTGDFDELIRLDPAGCPVVAMKQDHVASVLAAIEVLLLVDHGVKLPLAAPTMIVVILAGKEIEDSRSTRLRRLSYRL